MIEETIGFEEYEAYHDLEDEFNDDWDNAEDDPSETHCDTCGYIHETCDCNH